MSTKKNTLIDLRNVLETVNKSVRDQRGDGIAPQAEVFDLLFTKHGKLVKSLNDQLVRMALGKLNNDVSERKGPQVTVDGRDLFGSYTSIRKSITLTKGIKKDITKASAQEINLYLKASEHHNEDKNQELRRLMVDHQAYILSPDDTVEEFMKRKFEAEGAGELSL